MPGAAERLVCFMRLFGGLARPTRAAAAPDVMPRTVPPCRRRCREQPCAPRCARSANDGARLRCTAQRARGRTPACSRSRRRRPSVRCSSQAPASVVGSDRVADCVDSLRGDASRCPAVTPIGTSRDRTQQRALRCETQPTPAVRRCDRARYSRRVCSCGPPNTAHKLRGGGPGSQPAGPRSGTLRWGSGCRCEPRQLHALVRPPRHATHS